MLQTTYSANSTLATGSCSSSTVLHFIVGLQAKGTKLVSQARPFPFHSTDHFRYRHMEAYWKQLVLRNGKGLGLVPN